MLYPDDRTYEGKELRLKQQHFFVSSTIQDVVRRYKESHPDNWEAFPDKVGAVGGGCVFQPIGPVVWLVGWVVGRLPCFGSLLLGFAGISGAPPPRAAPTRPPPLGPTHARACRAPLTTRPLPRPPNQNHPARSRSS